MSNGQHPSKNRMLSVFPRADKQSQLSDSKSVICRHVLLSMKRQTTTWSSILYCTGSQSTITKFGNRVRKEKSFVGLITRSNCCFLYASLLCYCTTRRVGAYCCRVHYYSTMLRDGDDFWLRQLNTGVSSNMMLNECIIERNDVGNAITRGEGQNGSVLGSSCWISQTQGRPLVCREGVLFVSSHELEF